MHIAHAYSDTLHLRVDCVHVVLGSGRCVHGVTLRTCTVMPRVSCVSVYIALLRFSLSLALASLVRAALMRFHAHTRSRSAVCGVFLRVIQLSHVGKILWMLAFHRELCNAKCTLKCSFVEFQNVRQFPFLLYVQSRPKVVLIVVKGVDTQAQLESNTCSLKTEIIKH